MAKLVLEREKVVLGQGEMDELFSSADLANAAKQQLGYGALGHHIEEVREKTQRSKPMREALAELNIEPFSESSVAVYQAKMARRAAPKSVAIEWLVNIALMICITAIVLLVVTLTIVVGLAIFSSSPEWAGKLVTLEAVSILAAFFTGGPLSDKKLKFGEWVSIPIQEYGQLIPEFALQTALDLKEKCPRVKFYIQELQLKERLFDPFLIAEDEFGNAYWLEVWNEPDFKQKREY